MKNFFRTFFLCAFLTVILTVSARAAEDTLKVGLYYGNNALFSANLENYQGSGYYLGWFDEGTRNFQEVGYLGEETISMTADGPIYINNGTYQPGSGGRWDRVIGGYHVQLDESFASFEEARYAAQQLEGGFVAFLNNEYRVRLGHFTAREEAEVAAATYATYTWEDRWGDVHAFRGSVASPSATGVTVTVTGTDTILFEFDCSGAKSLGISPDGAGEESITWFRGYKWYGGFEYRRSTGGYINVINVVDIDDYVRGVLPYEMNPAWPLEALKAQAVVARTYAKLQTKHYASYRFDVCNTIDCQVYQGVNLSSGLTEQAAMETAGIVVTYGGEYAETTYYSSNGGASESSENVWPEARPYLIGKEDPYEATISIPDYAYTVTYTFDQLTRLLHSKDYDIGTVVDAYVSQRTPTGNVGAVTFVDSGGDSAILTGEACRLVLSSSIFGEQKTVKSMRFAIYGGSGEGYAVNSGGILLPGLEDLYLISGAGEVLPYEGDAPYIITAGGVEPLQPSGGVSAGDSEGITITGTGYGHNVGMSQYGAKAMAELGYTYEDILYFYYTDIELERIG